MFKLLLDIYNHIQNNNPNSAVLSQALTISDNSNLSEPPLIKALRKDRYDLLELILGLNKEKYLKYDEVLCLCDS